MASGKSSLLMHFALKEALSGRHSAFICQKEKIEKSPPVLPEGIDPASHLLDRVHMKSFGFIIYLINKICIQVRFDTPRVGGFHYSSSFWINWIGLHSC